MDSSALDTPLTTTTGMSFSLGSLLMVRKNCGPHCLSISRSRVIRSGTVVLEDLQSFGAVRRGYGLVALVFQQGGKILHHDRVIIDYQDHLGHDRLLMLRFRPQCGPAGLWWFINFSGPGP